MWNKTEGNAIALGKTPVIDSLYKKYPNNKINASGKQVGLPNDQAGNSEAGHMNIGAGRVVEQDSISISKALTTEHFLKIQLFCKQPDMLLKINLMCI